MSVDDDVDWVVDVAAAVAAILLALETAAAAEVVVVEVVVVEVVVVEGCEDEDDSSLNSRKGRSLRMVERSSEMGSFIVISLPLLRRGGWKR